MNHKANNITNIFCFVTLAIIFIFFLHTLNYPWRYFDENIIFQETLQPIPKSFGEIFEFISAFGIHNYSESANVIYSNISNIRGTPLDTIFNFFILWLFQKNPFNYHLFSLLLHVANSGLLFLILQRIHHPKTETCQGMSLRENILISILTLIWALHPVNVESVVFTINFGALVTYFFCFLFFIHRETCRGMSLRKSVLIFIVYLFPLFLNEYSVTLPIIIFVMLFSRKTFHGMSLQNNEHSFKSSFIFAAKQTLPLFLSLIVYSIYFFMSPKIKIVENYSLILTLERMFWLSSQILFHDLKLIFLPINLSIDQSALVKFSPVLFAPYSIFCFALRATLGITCLISLFNIKKTWGFCLFNLLVPFFLALLPFLHIISPIYCLSAERYLYFPLALFIIGIGNILVCISQSQQRHAKACLYSFLCIILCVFGTRSYLRTLDWKDSTTLLQASINTTSSNLIKALRTHTIAESMKNIDGIKDKNKLDFYNKKALVYLKKAMHGFKEEEKLYQNNTPNILKYYGLDPKTLKAKTAFLQASIVNELYSDPIKANKIFSKYIDDLAVIDTNVLDFYYRNLFINKKLDEAEKILNKSLSQNRISSILFVTLSDLHEYKYNDLKATEKYLLESFKYFPYDIFTLFGLKRYYQMTNNASQFAHYAYLYGLRTREVTSLQEAASIYLILKQNDKAKKIIKKLTKDYPINEETLKIKTVYENQFGAL